MSAADVREMAAAWPNLQVLNLQPTITDVTPGSLVVSSAFNSLLFLATGCPKLVTLRIATDSIDVPDAASWPEMHHGLKYLDLRLKDEQFPRSSVLPMAHLLDRIFPTLRSVIVTNTEEPNHYIDEDGVALGMNYGMLYVCSKRSEIGIAHDRYANPDCVLGRWDH